MKRLIFWRMVVSHIIILLIPILIFFLFFRLNTQKLIKGQLDELQQAQMERVAFLIEKELNQLDNVAKIIGENLDFSLLRMGEPLPVVNAQRDLLDIKISNNFINAIAYHPLDSDRYYTEQSPLYKDLFYEDFLMMPLPEGSGILENREGLVFAGEGRIFFIRRLPMALSLKRAVLAVRINDALLERYMAQLFAEGETGIISLANDKGEELAFDAGLSSSDNSDRLSHRVYSIEAYGLHLHLRTERSLIYTRLDQSSLTMMLVIILVLVSMIPLIYYLVQRNYIPIQHLRDYLLFHGGDEDQEDLDTITLAERKLDSLYRERESLEREAEFSRSYRSRELLRDLLLGHVDEPNRFAASCAEGGIDLSCSCFCVMDLINENGKNVDYDAFPDRVRVRLGGGAVYGIGDDDRNRFILLLGGEDLGKARLEEVLFRPDGFFSGFSVAVSSVVREWNHLSRAYLEVRSVQEHRFILGTNRVLFGGDILARERDVLNYPSWPMENLAYQVAQGDGEAMEEAVSGLMDFLLEKKPTLYIVRCVSYDMVNSMVKAAISVTHGEKACLAILSRVDLTKIARLDRMKDTVLEVGRRLVDLVKSCDGAGGESLSAQMIDFVRNRAFDPLFTAEEAALRFGLSLSNFSHRFKGETGTTFRRFLGELRMDRARDLLLSTELSLTDIVREIGYADTNSFIKKFKGEAGMTPMEYRRRSRPVQN